ncbi:MAG TPA: response regulator transcription factor [Chloroflexia bacterium]|nr:response regulator transcription factor [Chloroflexia bacterium]
MTIRVVIVDDHNVVRQGLKSLLSLDPEIDIVGMAADGEAGINQVRELKPEVLLLDLLMPGMDGLQVLQEIRPEFPELRILILTSVLEEKYISNAVKAGANGYLLKNMDAKGLVRSIKNVVNGPVQISQEAAYLLAGTPLKDSIPEEPKGASQSGSGGGMPFGGNLTERESEVLRLLAEGKANKEIARHMNLSVATIKTHVSIILGKLGLESRTQAAIYATNNGLLDKEPLEEEV